MNHEHNIEETENKATGLARLALACLTSDRDPNKAPLAKNIIGYTDREDTLDRITKKINSTIYRCAEQGLMFVHIILLNDKSTEVFSKKDIDPYLKDTDLIIMYTALKNRQYRRPYGYIELYARESAWKLFDDDRVGINGMEKVSRAIAKSIEMEYIKPVLNRINFGSRFYSIPEWIPTDFREKDHDMDSIIEALKLGVPYEDVFADYNLPL